MNKIEKVVFSLILLFYTLSLNSASVADPLQIKKNNMRALEELINKDEPGWDIVSDWIGKASNKVEVLAKDQKRAEETLVQTQVTTRSLMGAVVYETGGILVDNGWIRILGSGSEKMNRTLSEWNKGKNFWRIRRNTTISICGR